MPGIGPTDPSEAYFDKGVWGHDGSVWRKLPLVFGYTDRLAVRVSSTSHPAGLLLIETSVVPAGQIWVVQAAYCLQATTAGSFQWIRAFTGTVPVYFSYNAGITAGIPYPITGMWTLKPGDKVQATFGNTVLNEYAELAIWGYVMGVS